MAIVEYAPQRWPCREAVPGGRDDFAPSASGEFLTSANASNQYCIVSLS